MAAIVSSKLHVAPTLSINGTAPPTYKGIWVTEVDQHVDAKQVLALARGTGDPKVPKYGDAYSITTGGVTSSDNSSFALNFSVVPFDDAVAFPKLWKIEVTWRAPKPGQNEQPAQTQITNPLLRPPEYWNEYQSGTREINGGTYLSESFKNVFNVSGQEYKIIQEHGNEYDHMVNSIGEVLPADIRSETELVMVRASNVASDAIGISLNGSWGNRLNAEPWRARGLTIGKHKAMYLRATTGRVQFESGVAFYRLEQRIAVGRREWYKRQRNVAQAYISDPEGSATLRSFADADGIQLMDTLLKLDGTKYIGFDPPPEIIYRTLPEKNFTQLGW